MLKRILRKKARRKKNPSNGDGCMELWSLNGLYFLRKGYVKEIDLLTCPFTKIVKFMIPGVEVWA
jgi:hypothetical protein